MKKLQKLCLMAAVLLLGACQQTSGLVYLPGPKYPRPDGGFTNQNLWTAATAENCDRMLLIGAEDPDAANGDLAIYRTLWNSKADKETFMLCLEDPGASLGSVTQWNVYAYDKENEQVYRGQVGFVDMTPLGLIEVKVDSEILPEEAQNTWMLAVIASQTDRKEASLDGLKIGNWPNDPTIAIELVQWKSRYPWIELPYGNENLNPREIRSIEYRQVEPGLTVTPDGRLKFTK